MKFDEMFDSSSESSDSEINIMKKCLDVELPPDFDPTKTPETGEEFVQYVMYERKKCKRWVVADNIDRSKFAQNQTVPIIILNDDCVKTHESMLPSKEWQIDQVTKFKEFRKFLSPFIPETPSRQIVHSSHLLDKLEYDTPTLSNIVDFSQGSKLKMLEIILGEMEKLKPGCSFSYNTGIWIFGIVSTLAIPLSPDTCYSLRELARRCALIRSKLPPSTPYDVYTPLNTFICIVGRCFNQLDLADPY